LVSTGLLPREGLNNSGDRDGELFGMGCAKQAEANGRPPSRGLRQSRPPEQLPSRRAAAKRGVYFAVLLGS